MSSRRLHLPAFSTQAIHLCAQHGVAVQWFTMGGKFAAGTACSPGRVQQRIRQYTVGDGGPCASGYQTEATPAVIAVHDPAFAPPSEKNSWKANPLQARLLRNNRQPGGRNQLSLLAFSIVVVIDALLFDNLEKQPPALRTGGIGAAVVRREPATAAKMPETTLVFRLAFFCRHAARRRAAD
jgi:hypothetical protein